MKREIVVTVLLSALLALPAAAQGRGQGPGGAGGTVQRGGADGAQRGQRGPVTDTGQRGGQPGPGQQETRGQQQARIRATEQQRAQIEACTKSGNQVSVRAREMAEAAKGGGANNAEFLRLHERLRQEIQTMHQERDRFTGNLSDEQRSALQDRIRKLDQARDRLNERTRLLDAEIAKPEPDRKRIRDYANGVDKATKEVQKRLRETAGDMSVES